MFIFILILLIVIASGIIAYSNKKNKTSFWDSTYGESTEEARKMYGGGIQCRPLINPNAATPIEKKDPEYISFDLEGTELRNEDMSRQIILKKIKSKEDPFNTGSVLVEFDLKSEDLPAVIVTMNSIEVGTVPSSRVDEFIDVITKNENYEVQYDITGGGDCAFGCKITVTWEE